MDFYLLKKLETGSIRKGAEKIFRGKDRVRVGQTWSTSYIISENKINNIDLLIVNV